MSDHTERDATFAGSIPDVYERLLVPMIFADPAASLALRIAARRPESLLEVAAGTGVLTRALVHELPDSRILATDLNEAMLVEARAQVVHPGLEWAWCDAQDLRFPDASFDVVACQFGAMFFPDPVGAFREARRVLRPGGALALNVWDDLESNEIALVVHEALARFVGDGSLEFLRRTPYGHGDQEQLVTTLARAGLGAEVGRLRGTSTTTAREAAAAFCQGTPLRGEIELHPRLDVPTATEVAATALLEQYGEGVVEAPTAWLEVLAEPLAD